MKHKIFAVLILAVMASFGFARGGVETTNPTVQAEKTAPTRVALPKPAVNPTIGSWKYKETWVIPAGRYAGTYNNTFAITIKDDGPVWTVITAVEFSEGPVTDVSTLEKGTLILRRELFKHFLHKEAPWKPVEINLDFTGNKASGVMKYVNDPDRPVALDLGGPVFADIGHAAIIGCLSLADGYSTTLPYLDIQKLAVHPETSNKASLMQVKVVGMERVTVPAGTFDSYKVETSTDRGFKQTLWIAKDSRIPVKTSYIEGTMTGTTEMVP